MKLTELLLNRFLYKESLQNIETKDSSYNAGNVIEETPPPVPAGGSAQDINTSNVFINTTQLVGPIPPALLDVANWGWTQTCAFTSTDLDTVSWGAGSFKSASGVVYTISAGNTGNMSAKTYIYLDLNVSPTAYQITTTPATSVGLGKVLIAVAQNGASSATYNLNEASQIVGDNILANTINATKLNVGQLSAITADLGTITAGLITGAVMQTATTGYRLIMSGTNNSYEFRSGTTLLAEMKAMIEPYSGLAGAVFQHGTGNIGLSIYGQGIGLGDRAATFFTAGGTYYFSVIDQDIGAGIIDSNMDWATTGDISGGNLSGTNTGDQFTNVTASSLIGRGSASSGAAQEITLGTGLTMSGTTLSASAGANTALSNLASVAINTSLISDSDGIDSLGSSTYAWKNLYLGNGGNLYYDASIAFDFVTNTGIFVGSAGGAFDEFSPYTNIGVNLGSASYKWGTLYVDSIEVDALTVTTNITMSTAYIDGVTAIYFDDRSTAPGSPGNGTMYAYTSGGTYQMRVYLNGAWYSFNVTAV